MTAEEHGGAPPADPHYHRLKADLLAGRFPPGTALYETSLGSTYGVSRTPMREALARLAQDRLIERSARGYVVRRRSAEEILAIYEARIALETTAAELAAGRAGRLDVERLEHLLERRRAEEDPERVGEHNERFHRALREAAHSEVIASMLGQLDDQLAIYRPDRSPPPAPDTSVADHRALLDTVRAGEATSARAVMSEHLVRMRDLRVASLIREVR